MDTLIQQGAQSFDPAARATTYQQLCKALADDMPWNVMWQTTRYWIVNNRIGEHGQHAGCRRRLLLRRAENWYIKP